MQRIAGACGLAQCSIVSQSSVQTAIIFCHDAGPSTAFGRWSVVSDWWLDEPCEAPVLSSAVCKADLVAWGALSPLCKSSSIRQQVNIA